jgi:hypothetical protein
MKEQLRGARGAVPSLLGSLLDVVLYMRNPHKELLLQRYPPRRRHYHWIELRRVLLVTRSFASPFFSIFPPPISLLLSLSPV